MSGAIEIEPTADVELWTLYQWLCHDCPVVDGVPTAYGDAESLTDARRAIIRHKREAHNEWQPAPLLPTEP
jgi:hypothetical protein